MHTLILCLFSLPNVVFVFVSFYAKRGTKTRDLLRSVRGVSLFSKRRAPFFCVCSAKKDRPEDKKRRRRVVGVLVLVSAVSSVARAFPRRVFRVFVVVALSLSYEFSKLRVNNYLVVVPFSSFSVCLFDLFRSFVVAFFFLEREKDPCECPPGLAAAASWPVVPPVS